MKPVHQIIYILSLPLLLWSCSQDEPDEIGHITDDVDISFVANLPVVSSRSTYDVASHLIYDGFTVSAICAEGTPDANGILPTHFIDQTVTRHVDNIFRSDSCKWPNNAFGREGHLKFFAFHPSRTTMMDSVGVGEECFVYSNQTKKGDSGIAYDFRLTKFRVAPDISRQVDFVTAIGEGNKTAHIYSDIQVGFEHQLSGVEIGVWGDIPDYDIEIAGVRVGGIVVEADFNLATEIPNPAKDDNTIGSWLITDKAKSGHVDYVYVPGEHIVQINATSHNNKEEIASIMGKGGKAMVIPNKYDKWDYKGDRTNERKGSYLSVLLRVREREGDRHIVYPSTEPESRDHIVFFSVRTSDGMIMRRLTASEYPNYTAPEGQEKRAYGWAAAPAAMDWKPGYTYSYVLNYKLGVGVHDPADGNPAAPIIDWEGLDVTTTSSQWGDGDIIYNSDWGANSNKGDSSGRIWWR